MKKLSERVWQKFHPVFGPDLKVGFETTFPKGAVPDNLDPLYEKSGLVHKPPNENLVRIYEPATKVVGSCVDDVAAQVFFEPVSQVGSLFRRLVFARKVEHSAQKPQCWMVAARHGEIATFGFDSWNSKSQRYLALAYSGKDGQFIPVYVKIKDRKEGEEKEKSFIYLEVWAMDDEVKVLVVARRIDEKDVPEQLRLAMPWEKIGEGKGNSLTISFF